MKTGKKISSVERCAGFAVLYTSWGKQELLDRGMSRRTINDRLLEFEEMFGFDLRTGGEGWFFAMAAALHHLTPEELSEVKSTMRALVVGDPDE